MTPTPALAALLQEYGTSSLRQNRPDPRSLHQPTGEARRAVHAAAALRRSAGLQWRDHPRAVPGAPAVRQRHARAVVAHPVAGPGTDGDRTAIVRALRRRAGIEAELASRGAAPPRRGAGLMADWMALAPTDCC